MQQANNASTTAKLSLVYGGYSAAGVKEDNEDAFTAFLPTESLRQSKGALACIADGVSCSENAQLASQTSVTTFIEDYLSTPDTWDVKMSSARVLSSLNSWLYHQGQVASARHNGLVTTFSGLIIKSASAHILHCGDSRVYRYRGGKLTQLSTDHCLQNRNGSDTLIRGLGMDRDLKVDYQQRSARVDDIFMLTTDGVHGVMNDAAMTEHLETLSSEKLTTLGEGRNASLETVAKCIVEQALAAGSQDNLSCLLVHITSLPLEDINEVHRKLTSQAIPPVLKAGNKLDDYVIERVLHSGTRSHIYLARHPRMRQPLIIKAPAENHGEDPLYLEGFIREQWIGRRIDNPGVMKIMEPDTESRFLYHVCEYIEGQTLRQWMHDNPQPDLSKVRELAQQIAAAVRVFQRMGMLHRDLKPENIMLTTESKIKLIDFGTVRVRGLQDISSPLAEDTPAGTVDYIAPEFLVGELGLYRSDIFSLGVILYEMCTGVLPYKAVSRVRSRHDNYSHWRYKSALSHRKDLPQWVDLALKKACNPNPRQRYEALSEFMTDLETPNRELLQNFKTAPLIEKNPVLFWQVISGVLFLILVLQWIIPAL